MVCKWLKCKICVIYTSLLDEWKTLRGGDILSLSLSHTHTHNDNYLGMRATSRSRLGLQDLWNEIEIESFFH